MVRRTLSVPAARLALVVLLVLLGTAATPRRATPAPIQISVAGCWGDPIQGGAFLRVAESFNNVQSAIHVKGIRGPSTTQILTQISAGNPPDIYYDCSTSDLGQWAANGYILNLDPYIRANHFNVNTIIPSARGWSTFNGHVYSMPLLEDTFMLLYNKKLFREAGISKPPATIEEMTADALKLTKRDASGRVTQLGWGPALFGGDYIGTWLAVYMTMFGGSLVDPTGKKITANCKACVAALTWETNYYKTIGPTNIDKFASGFGAEYSPANAFFTGKVAMIVNGEYYSHMTRDYAPKTFNWGNVPLPHPANRPDLANSGLAGGNPGMILKGSKHPDAAFKFLMYMETVGPTVAFANAINNVPQLYDAITSPKLDPNPHYRAFVRYASGKNITHFPVLPVSSDYADQLTRIEQLVIHGKMTPQQGLDKVTSVVQTKLDQQQSGI
jgi:multiple sugar transport system substrate-binding protein